MGGRQGGGFQEDDHRSKERGPYRPFPATYKMSVTIFGIYFSISFWILDRLRLLGWLGLLGVGS